MVYQDTRKLIEGLRNDEASSISTIHLTAYENLMSKLAQSFMSSPLGLRYHLGTSHDRVKGAVAEIKGLVFKGLPGLYDLEEVSHGISKKLFKSEMSDLRPLSGVHAVICTLTCATNPGDLVYSIDPNHGGHFATKNMLNSIGRESKYLPWNVEEFSFDLEHTKLLFEKHPPKAIIFDHGAPLFPLNVSEIKMISPRDCTLIYDASHTLGLIAGNKFQNPFDEGCQILQGNTHKSFPGPQKGIIHFSDLEFGQRVINKISAGFVSSQHTHHSIALYLSLIEMKEFANSYAEAMIANAKTLAENLLSQGLTVYQINGVCTKSHELLIVEDEKSKVWAERLINVNLSINSRPLFGHNVLRIGTQSITRRGMRPEHMPYLAKLVSDAVFEKRSVKKIRKDVLDMATTFRNVHFSFDKDFGLWA